MWKGKAVKEVLWLEVTQDEYELPLAVAGSQQELARIIGTTVGHIKCSYSKYIHGKNKTSRFRKVEVEE